MKEISLHILDLLENSFKAGASLVRLTVDENREKNLLYFEIEDNGCGMSAEFLKSVTDPYTTTRTTRKVGMGIPLTKLACEQTGGSFMIESVPRKGTKLRAEFVYDSIDRQPLGDIASTVLITAANHEETDFIYIHRVNGKEFVLDTRELKNILGDVSFNTPEVYNWLGEYLKENIENLYGGV